MNSKNNLIRGKNKWVDEGEKGKNKWVDEGEKGKKKDDEWKWEGQE